MAVYLLHFDRPFRHAQHYLGYTSHLERRIEVHRNATPRDGKHHRLLVQIKAAGIGFTVARTWPSGDLALERKLKRQGGRARLCPICCQHTGERPRFQG